MAQGTEDRNVVKELDTSTKLAFERTRVAYERTMQAWIRTATSLITFGFTVYKFFQIDRPPNFKPPQGQLIGSQQFGEILVLLGLGALLLSSIEYRGRIRELEKQYPHKKTRSLSVFLASAMSLLGVLALLSMFFRW
jgi:putative membrane protein